MVNEATIAINESVQGQVIQNYPISGSVTLDKGTLMNLTDGRGTSGSAAVGEPMAGILARDLIAGDGRTSAPVHKKGYFDVVASGAVTVGNALVSNGYRNCVQESDGTYSGSQIMGYAEETAISEERFVMRLDL